MDATNIKVEFAPDNTIPKKESAEEEVVSFETSLERLCQNKPSLISAIEKFADTCKADPPYNFLNLLNTYQPSKQRRLVFPKYFPIGNRVIFAVGLDPTKHFNVVDYLVDAKEKTSIRISRTKYFLKNIVSTFNQLEKMGCDMYVSNIYDIQVRLSNDGKFILTQDNNKLVLQKQQVDRISLIGETILKTKKNFIYKCRKEKIFLKYYHLLQEIIKNAHDSVDDDIVFNAIRKCEGFAGQVFQEMNVYYRNKFLHDSTTLMNHTTAYDKYEYVVLL